MLLQPPKAAVQTTTITSSTTAGGRKLSVYVGNLTWVNMPCSQMKLLPVNRSFISANLC